MELALSLNPALRDFFRQFEQATSSVSFQYVDVTFSTANTDLDIRHSMIATRPDEVRYQLVKADRSCNIYNDQGASRKVWQKGYVILRCSAANANVRILLTVERP